MKKVTDPKFRKYGRVLDLKIPDLLERLGKTPLTDEVVYVAAEPSLEAAAEFDAVRDSAFGGIPIQIGYCNGKNDTLNAIEYHRCSEINIAYQGAVLIVGCQQDIEDDFTYDTGKMEMFEVPAGCAVELYATTLHYAPCSLVKDGFQVAIVLAKGTNEEAPKVTGDLGEDRLLAARNKWLIAHKESGLGEGGAFVGLKGGNLKTGIKF